MNPPGDILSLAALRQEEAKFEKEVSAAQQQLDTVRAAIKLLGGMNSNGKTTGSSSDKVTGSGSSKTTGSSSGKTTGLKKRVMSAAARARISKATKERWAKFRAAKAKGKN
jgi:hypothetical protein